MQQKRLTTEIKSYDKDLFIQKKVFQNQWWPLTSYLNAGAISSLIFKKKIS